MYISLNIQLHFLNRAQINKIASKPAMKQKVDVNVNLPPLAKSPNHRSCSEYSLSPRFEPFIPSETSSLRQEAFKPHVDG